jgi:hypothetical protein
MAVNTTTKGSAAGPVANSRPSSILLAEEKEKLLKK